MGTYRLLLAILVVLFHFGGMSALTGRTAVFGFYALSGYLMLLVLDRVYSRAPGGTRKFYVNRLLRIYPPYLLCVALTALVVAERGVAITFAPGNTGALLSPAVAHYGVVDYLRELAFGNHSLRTPANAGVPGLIPQAWSLGVEMIFYALAPLLLVLGRSWRRWVAVAIPLLAYDVTTLALGLPLDEWRYKSFLGSALVFLAGAALYRFRESVPRIPRAPLVAAAGALVLLAALHRLVGPPTNARFYALVLFEVLLTAVVVQCGRVAPGNRSTAFSGTSATASSSGTTSRGSCSSQRRRGARRAGNRCRSVRSAAPASASAPPRSRSCSRPAATSWSSTR
jgi:peptidoglycan/LPS O-acetylase OafA/YrhL